MCKYFIQFLVLILLILSSGNIKAQSTDLVFEGSIGSYPIVMHWLANNPAGGDIGYFYKKSKEEIKLEPSALNAENIKLIVKGWSVKTQKEEIMETFSLKLSDNKCTGTWTGHNKTLKVNLSRVMPSDISSAYDNLPYMQKIKKEQFYEYMRLKDVTLPFDSISSQNNKSLAWHTNKLSGITLFQIRDGYPKQIMNAINDSLKSIFLEEIDNVLTCHSFNGEGEYSQTINNVFLGTHIVSLNMAISYDCGGAHPDFGNRSAIYDATTGKELTLDDIIRFGYEMIPDRSTDKWYSYRSDVFAPAIVQLLSKLYPQEMKVPEEGDEEECNYTDPEVWNFPTAYFTEKGLYLGAYFARVLRPCDSPDWSIIPYENLKDIRNPKFNLALP